MRRWVLAGIALSILFGCERQTVPERVQWEAVPAGAEPEHNLQRNCVADYRPEVNYFPQQSRFNWSNQLSVEYGPHYKRVSFVPGVDTGETLNILLVQCGTPVPEHPPGTTVIQVPIQRLASGNSAML